jgi:O-antigen/teichoic acid export membrane protein
MNIWMNRLRSWSLRGGVAVMDQGLFSGGNFILNILLARWLSPVDYGAFSVAFAVFLFLAGFHNALLLEPMSVIGPARYPVHMRAFLSGQIRLHFLLTIPLGSLIALSGAGLLAIGMGDGWLPRALVGSGLALPFMLFLWMVRRMFYILQRPGAALLASGVYAATLLGGLWVIHHLGSDSSSIGFGLMGLTSLFSSLLTLLIWLKSNAWNEGDRPIAVGEILGAQWEYGKWLLAATFLSLGTGQAQTFFTAGLINLESAGALRALQNFILPMSQAVTAISTLGLPVLSFEYGRRKFGSLRRKGLVIAFALTALALAYDLILWLFAAPLEHYLYQAKYANYAWLLPILGFVPVFTALATGYSVILRAIQKPQHYLIAGVATAPVGLISGFLFTLWWGVQGTIISLVLTGATQLIIAYVLYKRLFPFGELRDEIPDNS